MSFSGMKHTWDIFFCSSGNVFCGLGRLSVLHKPFPSSLLLPLPSSLSTAVPPLLLPGSSLWLAWQPGDSPNKGLRTLAAGLNCKAEASHALDGLSQNLWGETRASVFLSLSSCFQRAAKAENYGSNVSHYLGK